MDCLKFSLGSGGLGAADPWREVREMRYLREVVKSVQAICENGNTAAATIMATYAGLSLLAFVILQFSR